MKTEAHKKKIVIVGAGIAGMTAAMHAIKKGYSVTILERTKHIGGRCASHFDSEMRKLIGKQAGKNQRHLFLIDNGQHLISYSYKHFFTLLDWFNTKNMIEKKDDLKINCIDVEHNSKYKLSFGGSKWNNLRSVLNIKHINILDKCKLLYFISYLVKHKEQLADYTVLEVCKKLWLSDYVIKRLLEPIVLSIMNAPIDLAPASLFIDTLLLAKETDFVLTHNRRAFVMLFKRLAQHINETEGCGLYLSSNVKGFSIKDGVCRGVVLANGRYIKADAVISTLPPQNYTYINECRDIGKHFSPSAILSAYIWTAERLDLENEYNAIMGTNIQWIFDINNNINTNNNVNNNNNNGKYKQIFQYSIIISNFQLFKQGMIARVSILIAEELKKIFNKEITIYAMRVMYQKYATTLITKENYKLRPATRSHIKNLYLAGDWTDTGLPACMESAAKSGYIAVEAIVADEQGN